MSRPAGGRDDTGLARPLDLIHNSSDIGDSPPKPIRRVKALLRPAATKLVAGSMISKRLRLSWTTANCPDRLCLPARRSVRSVLARMRQDRASGSGDGGLARAVPASVKSVKPADYAGFLGFPGPVRPERDGPRIRC